MKYHESKCHIHICTVKVSVILACKGRTEQQAKQGTIHPPRPSAGLRYKVMQGCDTSVQI